MHDLPAPRLQAAGPGPFSRYEGGLTVRSRYWLLAAVLAGALAPATAHAAAPPLTADFTAVDLPAGFHAWSVTGGTATTVTIAAKGTVTFHFNQVAGVNAATPHDVYFQT